MLEGICRIRRDMLDDFGIFDADGGNPSAIGVEDPKVVEHVAANSAKSLKHGSVVIAAITSCTNTSNPSVLIAAGLLAKKAVERGLTMPPWVKTSLAPGSKVVKDYLETAGLMPYLEKLKFHLVGYGCTTCIGNSGPLPAEVSAAIEDKNLVVASVLSGNRNFEGRINSEVRANYLMSPPLVVAFALAGRIDIDLRKEPIGKGKHDEHIYLADIWPTQQEIEAAVASSITSHMFRKSYAEVYAGDERWRGLPVPRGETYAWEKDSTYIRQAPYFDGMKIEPSGVEDIRGARVLAVLGDSVTTDHISPAGSIKKDGPAGKYLIAHGVQPADFNSYGWPSRSSFLVDNITHLSLLYHGYQYHRTSLLRFPSVFPPRPLTLLTKNRSPVKILSYWARPHTSTSKLPIVFLHGIGIGLWPYVNFLSALKNHDTDVGIIAIEILPVSFRITHSALGREDMVRQIQSVLLHHGFEKFVLVTHS